MNTSFKITVLDRNPIPIPYEKFSIRQNSAIWFDGYYWLYADVVPWDNPYHPDTYDTSIHLFKSKDAENWKYSGEIIGRYQAGQWTANGVATPGACVFDGRIYVSYCVRGARDGSGHCMIGLSAADYPTGPFRELTEHRVFESDFDYSKDHPTLRMDDPYLVASNADGTGPGNERLYLYYRQSLNDFLNPVNRGEALDYRICCRSLTKSEGKWSEPYTVLHAPEGHVAEVADVRWIDGRLIMTVLGYDCGQMQIWVSSDSKKFHKAEPHLLENYLDIFMPAACFRLPGFIQDPDGRVRHMTTPGNIDEKGHYTMFIFRIEC